MKHAVQRLHFVGIGGAGMSAIAELLLAQGYGVSGSDSSASTATRRLAAMGATVHIGHQAAHLGDAQAVVTSTAVAADNPEVLAARSRGLPVVTRAQMLAELMRRQQGIAIAGTHGKTTTTALVAGVLVEAGADPSVVIGGELLGSASGARCGQGSFIVAEADESDASFLQLNPVLAVVTNIDADHMDTYGHSLQRLHGAFVDFLHRMPFYGRALMCSDDAGVMAIRPALQRPVRLYGLGEAAELRAVGVQAVPGGRMQFTATQAGHADLFVTLSLPGLHNVRNALAALAVARELGLADAAVQRALAAFAGVGRRFQCFGDLALPAAQGGGSFTLVDDYGHHPVEMAAVLEAARGAFPGRRLLLAFQPHRYTRTRDCLADFVAVLQRFDAVLLTEVYAAGETPLPGADGAALTQALRAAGGAPVFVPDVQRLPAAIVQAARAGDVVITLGAGSIGAVPGQLTELLGVRP